MHYFFLSHRDCLFLSYCGILMHIISLKHIVALHFVQIQQHPFDYIWCFYSFTGLHMVHTGTRVFLYIIIELLFWKNCLCELNPSLTIQEIILREPYVFEMFISMFISTSIVDIPHWRFLVLKISFLLIFSTNLTCFMCIFLSFCFILNKIIDIRWLWYVFT